MKNKRGLSAIVATLLIILLTLVAVGIIWVVIRNVVQSGANQVEATAKCTSVDISATAAACGSSTGNWTCNVTYYRAAGGDDIDGIKITLSNGLNSYTQDVPGNVDQQQTKTSTSIDTGLLSTDPKPTSVQIAAYINDASGNPQLCNPTEEFTNIG